MLVFAFVMVMVMLMLKVVLAREEQMRNGMYVRWMREYAELRAAIWRDMGLILLCLFLSFLDLGRG